MPSANLRTCHHRRSKRLACKYEYMRESQRLRDSVQQNSYPVLPSFLQENLNLYEVLRLMSALRKAHFPKPWNSLKGNAKRDLVLTVSKWDEERKKSDPPVVIEDATPTRDLEAELEQLPHARLLAGMASNPVWRNAFRRDARLRSPPAQR